MFQLTPILNKNFIEKRRNPCSTLCECFSHFIILIVLVLGFNLSRTIQRSARRYDIVNVTIPPTFINTSIPLSNNVSTSRLINSRRVLDTMQSYLSGPFPVPSFDNYIILAEYISKQFKNQNFALLGRVRLGQSLGNLIQLGVLHFAPYPSPYVDSYIQYMLETTTKFKDIKYYFHADEQSAVDYILNDNSERTFALIVFRQITPTRINYVIRQNSTSLPDTNLKYRRNFIRFDSSYQDYYLSGYLTLQDTVDRWAFYYTQTILNTTQNSIDSNLNGITPLFSSSIINTSNVVKPPVCGKFPDYFGIPFPSYRWNVNNYYTTIGPSLGLAFSLTMLYPMSRLIKAIVEEKETKMKDILKIMGLRGYIHILSWFLTPFITFLWIALSSAFLTKFTFLPKTNLLILIIYFLTFTTSLISLSFFISVFFTNSKLASICGPVFLIFGALPKLLFFNTQDTEGVSMKLAASLLSPTAFSFGADFLVYYEDQGTGFQFDNMSDIGFNMTYALGFMIIDFVIYAVLAWYLDYIFTHEGIWYKKIIFPVLPSYWLPSFYQRYQDDMHRLHMINPTITISTSLYDSTCFEPLSTIERSQIKVNIQNIYKKYEDGRIALRGLNLDLLQGEITCLLGHNGAGKSTIISILTGMIRTSIGECIIYNNSIKRDLHEIRQITGICPQQDILFPSLTVYEHLILFGKLKGLTHYDVIIQITQILDEVGLSEKAHVLSKALSGGQKRKLCLAMALIGNPKFVLLDEPTSGMDPYSRRSLWTLLQRYKENKVILFTTHYLDEADAISDRIAILTEGSLRCSGTSLFLKNRFGAGYMLTLSTRHTIGTTKVKTTQSSQSSLVPIRTNSIMSTNNTGILSSHNSNDSLSTNSTILQKSEIIDILTHKINEIIPTASLFSMYGGEIVYNLPLSMASKISELLYTIQRNQKELGILSYGINITSLEQVFIKLAHEKNGNKDLPDDTILQSQLDRSISSVLYDTLIQPIISNYICNCLSRYYNNMSLSQRIATNYFSYYNNYGYSSSHTHHGQNVAITSLSSTDNTSMMSPTCITTYKNKVPSESIVHTVSLRNSISTNTSTIDSSTSQIGIIDDSDIITTTITTTQPRLDSTSMNATTTASTTINNMKIHRVNSISSDDSSKSLLSPTYIPYEYPTTNNTATNTNDLINNQNTPNKRYSIFQFNRNIYNLRQLLTKKSTTHKTSKQIVSTHNKDINGTNNNSGITGICSCIYQLRNNKPYIQYATCLHKRYMITKRDTRGLFYQVIFPAIQILLILLILVIRITPQQSTLRLLADSLNLTPKVIVPKTSQEYIPITSHLSSTRMTPTKIQTLQGSYNTTTYLTKFNPYKQKNYFASYIFDNQIPLNITINWIWVKTNLNYLLSQTFLTKAIFDLIGTQTIQQNITILQLNDIQNILNSTEFTESTSNSIDSNTNNNSIPIIVTFRPTGYNSNTGNIRVTNARFTVGNTSVARRNLFINIDILKELLPSTTTNYSSYIYSPYTILHNTSSRHGLAIFNGELRASYFQTCSPQGDVYSDSINYTSSSTTCKYTAKNHPLPDNGDITLEEEILLAFLTILFILLPLCYIPAAFVSFIVRERITKAKLIQFVSSVHPIIYWCATYTWDMLLFLCIDILIMITFSVYGSSVTSAFIGNALYGGAIFVLLVLYGASVIPLCYLYSMLFDNPSNCQIVVTLINFATGFVLILAYNIIQSIPSVQSSAEVLVHFFRLFPCYNLGEGLIAIITLSYEYLYLGVQTNPFLFEYGGRNMCFMGVEAIGYFLIVLCTEHQHIQNFKSYIHKQRVLLYRRLFKNSMKKSEKKVINSEDVLLRNSLLLVDRVSEINMRKSMQPLLDITHQDNSLEHRINGIIPTHNTSEIHTKNTMISHPHHTFRAVSDAIHTKNHLFKTSKIQHDTENNNNKFIVIDIDVMNESKRVQALISTMTDQSNYPTTNTANTTISNTTNTATSLSNAPYITYPDDNLSTNTYINNIITKNKFLTNETAMFTNNHIIHNKTTNDYALLIHNLIKIYPSTTFWGKPKKAIRGLNLGLKKNEIFGLLGVNGAGKSTTMNILTGDSDPTSGSIYINNLPLSHPEARLSIGYCPQIDPLFDLLNSYETLWFYGRIRGISEDILVPRINHLIEELGLTPHAFRPCGKYSGGNKRKLSLAIALVGDPKLVLLDEPSSGMDPEARRHMWDVIEKVSQRCTIILTTHSMEECEALCTRIGIMVGGSLQCIGSSQHLKTKFGQGYEIKIQCATGQADLVIEALSKEYSSAILVDHHENLLTIRTKEKIDLAYTFNWLDNMKQQDQWIVDYAVSQTSLEQIFVTFASHDQT